MKKILPLLVALLVSTGLSAASFEGTITMKMSGPKDAPAAMTFSVKEGFTRLDMSGAEGRNAGIIFNVAKQEMTILMLDQKMYMTQALTAAQAVTAGGAEGVAGAGVAVTTTREKILGYDCVKYVVQSKEGTSEVWVTDQLGAFLGFGGSPAGGGRRGPGGPQAPQGWEAAITGKGVFPLRVVTTAGGKETFRLETTAIEKAALPASLFAPPADFQNLSDMMRGMGMPGGIPGLPGGAKLPGRE